VLKPQVTAQEEAQKKARTGEASSSSADASVSAQGLGTPIIIVPSALTSCITTINAAEFFERGVFVPVDEKMKAGGKREQELSIYRVLPDKRTVKFKVIDNPRLLRSQDWDRVVAVFALGQAWQFKDWKWSNPVELFRNTLGVHLTMDDRAVDTLIQSWNCKILKVYRFKRHMDAEAANEFWALLDDFIKLKKPTLWAAMNMGGSK
jgi:parafibromin